MSNNLNDSQVLLEKIRSKNPNENKDNKENKEKSLGETNFIYLKNIFKSEHAFIIKLSNGNIQITFTDNSFIIIDSHGSRQVIYQDKYKKVHNYNIHLVNKSTNKQFLKRYEYYKKIFYEKMEERLVKKQRNNNNCNNSNLEIEENMLMHIENEHNKTH